MQRDVQSLSDHATYLSNKITFLLDAMLGVVSLEQNNIIKIFSVAAVVFMPPTLIASIYGMNFKHMPELELDYGYPMAIVLMIARRGAAVSVLQVEEVAVELPARHSAMRFAPPSPPIKGGRGWRRDTTETEFDAAIVPAGSPKA